MDKFELDGQNLTIPYVVYESEQSRNERKEKRYIIALVISVFLIFASNIAWLYAWCQYDYSSTESVEIDSGEGVANYIGRNGSITNGENTSDQNTDPQKEEFQRD
jgi:hypothetical protein